MLTTACLETVGGLAAVRRTKRSYPCLSWPFLTPWTKQSGEFSLDFLGERASAVWMSASNKSVIMVLLIGLGWTFAPLSRTPKVLRY